ncbi:GntR family transcriptional regulator [Actinomycetospora sp. NBC_00405]|uniref:GntR family transcriptional regulator n=1 Tax=Actinomycetospora sp. NBC_00405 TaxID=2975952 RepID=UPI002E1C7833
MRHGDLLPTVKELAERYSVSEATAHRAVTLLAEADEATVSRGRRAVVSQKPVDEPVRPI